MSNSRMIGDVKVSATKSGFRYSAKFFVANDELLDYEPVIYAKASWAPLDAIVESYSKEAHDTYWLIDVNAVPVSDASRIFETGDANDFVEKSYEYSEVYFPSAWWGIKIADSDDEDDSILNINDEICSSGDYIFPSATADDKGEADYSLCPFKDPDLDTSLIEQKLKTIVYVCRFYSNGNINNFAGFCGLNGSFSSKCQPAETASYRWKAIDQSVKNQRDKDQKIWVSVERAMLLAPLGMQWDPAKNGGTWKW